MSTPKPESQTKPKPRFKSPDDVIELFQVSLSRDQIDRVINELSLGIADYEKLKGKLEEGEDDTWYDGEIAECQEVINRLSETLKWIGS